jgi:N-sulfoglucosamine sulfohydrolase
MHQCLATGSVVTTAAFSQTKNQTTKPRNVLLLISDDQGLSQLGCWGNEQIKTPNLDSMAENGIRFTNAFAVAASCSASRGTILSGLYTHQNGQYGHLHNYNHFTLLPHIETLPLLLKQNGYRTGVIGKLHVEPSEQLPFDYVAPGSELRGNRDVYTMAQKAGEFFKSAQDDPFFLLVGYSDPHRAGDGFANNSENPYPGIKPTRYQPEEVTVPYFLPDIKETRLELAEMYQSVTRLDSGIGMVLDKLKRSGQYDDTLIIYISDNGIPFPNAKTTIYDSGVHLPMIVNAPGIKNKGSTNSAMVSYIDLLPTILEWTETSGPEYQLPGRSFLSVLDEKKPKGWNEVFHSHTFHEITMYYPMRAIRTKRYKYIQNLFPTLIYPFATDLFASKTWQAILDGKTDKLGKRKIKDYLYRPAEELYDIQNDPEEVVNLASDSEYIGVKEGLRQTLDEMRKQTDDPWLINRNYRENYKFIIQD